MDPEALHRSARAPRKRGQVREGLQFVWRTIPLRDTLFLVAIVATFGFNFMIVLPLLAKDTFHGGAGIYGLLSSIMAIGSIGGALVTATRRPSMRFMVATGLGFGIATFVAAFAPTVATEAIVLIVVGMGSMAFIATANSTLQLGSPAALRGRVMAVYSLLFLGGTAIGGPVIGWITQAMGPRAGLAFGAGLSVIASGAVWVRRRNVQLRERAGARVIPITETSAMGDIAGDTPAPAAR
jgi:MFS family permease